MSDAIKRYVFDSQWDREKARSLARRQVYEVARNNPSYRKGENVLRNMDSLDAMEFVVGLSRNCPDIEIADSDVRGWFNPDPTKGIDFSSKDNNHARIVDALDLGRVVNWIVWKREKRAS